MRLFKKAKPKPQPEPAPQAVLAVDEQAHIREEMFKQNLELVDRNKTLSLLRQIDEIVLSSVTDAGEVAKRIAEAVIKETDFVYVSIMLADGQRKTVTPFAVATIKQNAITDVVRKRLLGRHIPMGQKSNLIAKAIQTKRLNTTHNMADFIGDDFEPDEAEHIQRALEATSFFVTSLKVRDELIGAMVIGSRSNLKDLSHFEQSLIDRLTGVIGIALDNTMLYAEIQEASQRLKTANRNLKALDKAKDEFISMASHQLRTPLTTIKGYLSMILEGDAGKLTAQQHEFLDYAFGGAERMVALISDLLNVSRLSAGRFLIEKNPTDLAEVVADEVRQLQTHADAKHLDLIYDKPAKLPMINIDEGKTRQVIMNFIDNAIYYTKQGSVTVKLEQTKDSLRLTVTDTGIGVPEDAKKKLFSKFFRAENAQLARPDGTGLGLYLAKRVVEDQGGTVIFETEIGKGSTFGFEMPLKSTK
jgi:signal transduction histidine kinase